MLMRGGAPNLPLARCGFVSFASWPIASLNHNDTDDFSNRSKLGWAQRLGHLTPTVPIHAPATKPTTAIVAAPDAFAGANLENFRRDFRVRVVRPNARTSAPFCANEFRFRLTDDARDEAAPPRRGTGAQSTVGPRTEVVFRNNHPAWRVVQPQHLTDLRSISATVCDDLRNELTASPARRPLFIGTLTSYGIARPVMGKMPSVPWRVIAQPPTLNAAAVSSHLRQGRAKCVRCTEKL